MKASPSKARASASTLVVLPVPGGPERMRLGMLPCCASTSKRPTVSSLPTISLISLGRYFSSHWQGARTSQLGRGVVGGWRMGRVAHRLLMSDLGALPRRGEGHVSRGGGRRANLAEGVEQGRGCTNRSPEGGGGTSSGRHAWTPRECPVPSPSGPEWPERPERP